MALGVPNSLMSAPPEKALPAPVMTMALTAASALALRQTVHDALAGGETQPVDGRVGQVITATLPWTLYSAVMLRQGQQPVSSPNGLSISRQVGAVVALAQRREHLVADGACPLGHRVYRVLRCNQIQQGAGLNGVFGQRTYVYSDGVH
jgi:hypothetical protein